MNDENRSKNSPPKRRAIPHVSLLVLMASLLATGASAADTAEAAAYYRKCDTWHDTLLAWHLAWSQRPQADVEPVPLPDFGDSQFTIAAWICTTRGGTIMARCPAAGNWAPQGKTFFMRGGRLAFDIGWVGVIIGKTPVADGRWHHVALAGGDNTYTLYVDGRLDAEGMLAAEPDPGDFVLRIGFTCENFPSPSAFDGLIDDLRLYRRRLTPEQIQSLCAGAAAIPQAVLAAWWPFDSDGADASGGRNHAVSISGAQFVPGRIANALRLDGKGRLDLPGARPVDASEAVWQLLERDFTDADSKQQMQWVRSDRIWQYTWQADDWRDLAARYAEAVSAPRIFADRARQLADKAENAADLGDILTLYFNSKRYARLEEILARSSPARLRKILHEEFAADSPQLPVFAARLAAVEEQVEAWQTQFIDPVRLEQFAADLQDLQRDILCASDPFSTFDKIIFVKRYTYQSSHYYTDFIDGCEKFGGNICTLDLNTGEVVDIVPSMAHGIFGRYDLSFDARRIVFAWKEKIGKGFRLYEVAIDGSGLRQLTFDPPDEQSRIDRYWRRDMDSWAGRPILYRHHTDDMDPAYLPDGGICFISTRCEYGILCDGPDYFTTTVLYRMDGDGGNIEKLSNSSLSEAYPVVANDGRILYTRWEYVDKGAVSAKCLWAMYPDGSASAEIYGNDIAIPSAFIQGRPIPDTNNRYIVIGGPHCCPVNGLGTVIRLDLSANYRTEQPMTYITPYVRMTPSGHAGFLHLRDGKWIQDTKGPLFIDPYPLTDKLFLVSQNADRQWCEFDAWDLYLLDETGAAVLIHDDPQISCYQPMPLRPRSRPPVLGGTRDEQLARENLAEVIVTDVYQGLDGIERGQVKYIRINEQVPRPWAARRNWPGDEYDQQHACITKNTHLGLKVQHGIVPVYPDGSARFLVPADRNIFFQVLDEAFMELQRERTFVNYRPGEIRSCVGCHEKNIDAPPRSAKMPLALRHAPHRPGPQPGEVTGARPIHYPADVQPILDAHCVKCHGGPEPKAGLDLTGTPTTLFSRSYENILDRKLIPVIGENHPKWENIHYLPPKSLGSHAARLIAHLKKGHNDVRLSREEWVRLTTWVDSNGQYYGSYYGRRNIRYKDHPNFRPTPTFAEAASTKAPLPEDAR